MDNLSPELRYFREHFTFEAIQEVAGQLMMFWVSNMV